MRSISLSVYVSGMISINKNEGFSIGLIYT